MHMSQRRNPAVIAGLAGAFTCVFPSAAHAMALSDVPSAVLSSPETAFVAGGVMGAVVAGAVSGIVCHALLSRDARAEHGAVEDEDAFETQKTATVPVAAAALVLSDRDSVAALDDEPAAQKPAKKAKHFRTSADASQQKPAAAAPVAAASVQQPAEPSEAVAAPAEQAPVAQKPIAVATALAAAQRPSSKPVPQPASQPAPEARKPRSHEATDYEQIATNYVNRATFRERMATRAQGVAETLRERMGRSMMDGLPVISRADGTVADVGTSWWNTSVGLASIAKVDDYVADDATGDLAIPSDFSETPQQQLVEAAQNAAAEFAKGDVAERVPFVDEGVFPEKHPDPKAFAEDDWASALRCMDERMRGQMAVVEPIIPMAFEDIVGDADTLDEPDGLEESTTFIPFKTPAGHPEVVDTETYVDYLIGDEFGRNSSKAARSGAGRFLRLLEGGTSTNRLNRVDDAPSLPRAKHFAHPVLAAEA